MDALRELLTNFIAFVPNLMGAILILVVGLVVSRIIVRIIERVLALVGIDKLGERLNRIEVVGRTGVKVSLSATFAKVVYYFLVLIVLVAATDVLGLEVVSNLVSSAIEYVPNLIAAIVMLVVGIILADALREIVTVTCRSFGIPAATMIGSIVFWFVFTAIGISALSQAAIQTEFIVTSLSILIAGVALAFALAYGLAAKPLMAGFLAQFYNRGKFNVGDTVDIGGSVGRILSIDRASISLDVEGYTMIIPLSRLQTETVVVVSRAGGSDPGIDSGNKPAPLP